MIRLESGEYSDHSGQMSQDKLILVEPDTDIRSVTFMRAHRLGERGLFRPSKESVPGNA
jgi:hypothetical protein